METFNIVKTKVAVVHYTNEADRNIQIWGPCNPEVKEVQLIGGRYSELNAVSEIVDISIFKVSISMI